MIDEEQGLPAIETNGKNHMVEYNKLKAPKDFIQRNVELLEIVQTRSIPEDEEKETVILTERDIKGDEKDNIITNTDLDLSDLLGKNIRVEPYSATTPGQAGLSIVQYTDLEGQLYFFPVAQCKTWFELLQKIEPTVRGSLDRYELTAEDGQLVTEENWSKRAEQEEPSRIRLTLTRKMVPSYSEREDTESDERSSETSSNISEEWHKLREQSLRKTDNSNLIQQSHSEAPNSVESDESAASNPLTAFPPRSTQPSAIKGRPTVTFTARPHSQEPSTLGETPLSVKSDSEANNEKMDTTIPDIPQSADSEKRGSTEYLSAVGLDENFTYS
ncbi:MAG: hypothetical protein Q9187_007916, partial [Circinaria calcarea]